MEKIDLKPKGSRFYSTYYRASEVDAKRAAVLAAARGLVEEVAQEAHTMGRIYEKTLSPINPVIEFNRVSDMAKKKLEQAIAAVERHLEKVA